MPINTVCISEAAAINEGVYIRRIKQRAWWKMVIHPRITVSRLCGFCCPEISSGEWEFVEASRAEEVKIIKSTHRNSPLFMRAPVKCMT